MPLLTEGHRRGKPGQRRGALRLALAVGLTALLTVGIAHRREAAALLLGSSGGAGGSADLDGLRAEVAMLQSSNHALEARLARLEGGQAAGASGQQQQQQQQQQPRGGSAAGAWAVPHRTRPRAWPEAANVSLNFKLPEWAACPDPPCQFSQMQDGAPTDVRCWDVGQWEPWHSIFGEDDWLFSNLFHNKRNGFMLEFGGMDGVAFSNSLWFERALGWRTMLFEACPGQYAALDRNRPNSIRAHAAVCDEFRSVHWLSAGAVGGIYEFMAPEFIREFHPGLRPEGLPTVPCVPLMYLLDKFGVDTIDLWTLDVEGGELSVLQTVDFERLRVGVLVVETDGKNKTKDAAITSLMESVGFETVPKGPDFNHMQKMNTVYINKDYKPFLRHNATITVIQT